MDVKRKQQWSVEETTCLLAVWSSSEIQRKLEGASRTKPVFEEIQREMAGGGYERSIDQIINKLKKLKKDYRDQKRDTGRSGNGRPRSNGLHFEMLDSVLSEELPHSTPRRSSSPGSGESRPGKRKRETTDMLEYLERAHEKFLQHSRDMNTALLQKLDEHAAAYVGLMGRMVGLMEAQLQGYRGVKLL